MKINKTEQNIDNIKRTIKKEKTYVVKFKNRKY